MNILYFMRHAESTGNAGQPSQDAWTLTLTELGHLQAAEAARHWIGSRDTKKGASLRLISSPMLRALETAEHVRNAAQVEQVEVLHDWHEYMPFDFSARGVTSREQRRSLMTSHWELCDPRAVGEGAGAESFLRFFERVMTALDETLKRRQEGDPTLLVVTHGGVIKLLQMIARDGWPADLPTSQMMRAWHCLPTVPNAHIVEIDVEKMTRS